MTAPAPHPNAAFAAGEPKWRIDAADLLAEPDPGPTAWLVDELIVDQALVAAVGRWKTTKSFALLDIGISVATGRPAFGQLEVPTPGAVLFVNEESGRKALWRRLDALCRGRAIPSEELRGRLHVAANARIRLDDPSWITEIIREVETLAFEPRLIVFDPLARMKAADRDENAQSGMAVLIDAVRQIRDQTGAAVCFVHHTGHGNGGHMRGSSDLETAWETRLEWKREGTSSEVAIETQHREAESGAVVRYTIGWDNATRSMRFDLTENPVEAAVQAFLYDNPDATANDVDKAVDGNRQHILQLVKSIREGGSSLAEPPRNHPSRGAPVGGSTGGLFRAPGTTTGTPGSSVPEPDVTGNWFTDVSDEELEALAADELERQAESHA
ncbi:MAG TPA: AAA family ATPase [Gaiellaceae bacterium]|nr:AAA family ATPase [Gaiellaceae bacterium]